MSPTLIVPVTLDVIMLLVGIGYSLALLWPRLGVRLLGQYAPARIRDLPTKRLATARVAAFGFTMFVIGIAGLLRDAGAAPASAVYHYGIALATLFGGLVSIATHFRLALAHIRRR